MKKHPLDIICDFCGTNITHNQDHDQGCENKPDPKEHLHPCPFQIEMNDNHDPYCDCDEEGIRECKESI